MELLHSDGSGRSLLSQKKNLGGELWENSEATSKRGSKEGQCCIGEETEVFWIY